MFNSVPVSICMPVYNGALYIRDAIRSVLNQTVMPQEIIISDSGSSDGSEEIVREETRRIQANVIILPTKTPGMVANWNSTIRAASGKYIKFLFQDDLLHPHCLEEMVKVAESDERIGFVFSPRELLIEPSEGDAIAKWLMRYRNLSAAFGKLKTSQPGSLLLRSPKLLQEPLNKIGEPTAVLVRTALFREVGLFNEKMRQLVDIEMWVRLMAISHVGYVSRALASLRVHAQRASEWHNIEEIYRFEQACLRDTLRTPTIYPLLHRRVQRALRVTQGGRDGFFASRVTLLVRRLKDLVWAIVPNSLRLRLHHFRRYHDYLWMPKQAVQYAEDSLFTLNTAPFLDDQDFLRAYHAGAQTNSWHGLSSRWRAHVACWAGSYASKLDGDFVECGVNRGGLARAIIDYVGFERLNKQFYLIDTFSGLVPANLSEEEMKKDILAAYSYYNDNSAEIVGKTFARFQNVKIVQGVVPDVLSSLPINRVAFLSLDMNCTMPEIRAAEHFWARMCPGGVMVMDDYGSPLHSERQKAFDQFARERGIQVLALPTGQGLIFKSRET
jgi:O-methyltransferase